jgi:hypothetical protein
MFFTHKLRDWEYALFHGENDYFMLPDVKLYAQITKEQIENDYRIVMESIKICNSTKNYDTYADRKKLAKQHYKHMQELAPFAEYREKTMVKEATHAINDIKDF